MNKAESIRERYARLAAESACQSISDLGVLMRDMPAGTLNVEYREHADCEEWKLSWLEAGARYPTSTRFYILRAEIDSRDEQLARAVAYLASDIFRILPVAESPESEGFHPFCNS